MKLTKQQEAYVAKIRHWQRNPQEWAAMMFPDVSFTTQQIDAWKDLGALCGAKLDRYQGKALTPDQEVLVKKLGISIMSGRGTGKDAWSAITIMWFMSVFDHPKIPTTAPSAHQLKDVLWSEISKWIRKARKNEQSGKTLLDEQFEWQSDKVFMREKKGKEWFAVARTVNVKASPDEQAETLSGFHENFMAYVVDEASGVPDPVYKPIEGTLTGAVNIVILIFNPTRTKGYAIASQYEDSGRWIAKRWNGEESELVSKDYIADQEAKYGRDSNTFRVNVLGLPPLVDKDTLIPADWIQDAINREITPLPVDFVVKGLDCGAGGDLSVMATRKGGKVYPFKTLNTADSNVLTDWAYADFLNAGDIMYADVIGVGWAVCGNLRSRLGAKVRSVDARGEPGRKERFYNKRAEMYWNLREEFEQKTIAIPNDSELVNELMALKYDTESGKTKILKKDAIRKEIGHSPDRADALAMTYSNHAAVHRKVEDYDDDEDREPEIPRQHGWMAA